MHPALLAILSGGSIAATVDIAYAFIFYWLTRGIPPQRILQSISSGLLGMGAYSGGAPTAALGLLLHYLIAIVAAAVFYAASRKLGWMLDQAVLAGLLFGLAMYGFMNGVVVPLAAFPTQPSFTPLVLITGLLVHMFGVGLPIALCVRAAPS